MAACSDTLRALAESYRALRSLVDHVLRRNKPGISEEISRLRENLPLLSGPAADSVSGIVEDFAGASDVSMNRIVAAMSRVRDAIVDEVLRECGS